MGVLASSGRAFQLDMALSACEEGDLLVLAFETSFWQETEPVAHSGVGAKVAWFMKPSRGWGRSSLAALGIPSSYPLADCRPGLRNAATMFTKVILGRPGFRYAITDVDDAGYMTTDYREEAVAPGVLREVSASLSAKRIELLEKVRDYSREKNFRVAISIPWQFIAEESIERARENNNFLSSQMKMIVPVLEDSYAGARSEREVFSDTGWHLSEDAAAERTSIVGKGILKVFPDMAIQASDAASATPAAKPTSPKGE